MAVALIVVTQTPLTVSPFLFRTHTGVLVVVTAGLRSGVGALLAGERSAVDCFLFAYFPSYHPYFSCLICLTG